jgi:ABC-2 type transport system permease protein/oleandomycin transport system permease protein
MADHVLSTPAVKPSIPQSGSLLQTLWWNFADSLVITRRNLMYYIRLPQLLVFSTIQPVMFLLLFTYVFGGAIQTPSGKYINYLLPGIIVQTALFGGTATAIGLAEDLSKGLVDRFRSLPMARAAVLAGRTIADSARNVFVVILMVIVGYIIDFRIQNGILNALLAFALVILFGHVFSWIFALVGMSAKDPETAQVSGFIWVFPLVFASSIFVPPTTMPDWLRYFAENQPVSVTVNTVRGLILGTPTDDWWKAVLWMVGIYLVFMPLAVWRYRQTSR